MWGKTGYWHTIIREAVEEFFGTLDAAENFVHDELVPEILEADDAADRDAFYSALDMQHVKDVSPKIWQRITQDALDIQERSADKALGFVEAFQKQQAANAAPANTLDKLNDQEMAQDSAFLPEIRNRPILGLHTPGDRVNTLNAGLDSSAGALPMG